MAIISEMKELDIWFASDRKVGPASYRGGQAAVAGRVIKPAGALGTPHEVCGRHGSGLRRMASSLRKVKVFFKAGLHPGDGGSSAPPG